MRNFDVKIRNYNLAQYWSALDSTENRVKASILDSPYSDIVFNYSPSYIVTFDEDDPNLVPMFPTRYSFDDDMSYGTGRSLRFHPTTAGQSLKIANFKVVPGEKYRFHYYTRKTSDYNGTGGNAKIRIAKANDAGLLAAFSYGADTMPLGDTWYEYTKDWSIPVGVDAIDIQFGNDGNAGYVWIDELTITKILPVGPSATLNNRNIVSDSPTSIQLGVGEGVVTGPEFKDFGLSMIVLPNASDTWLFKFPATVDSDTFTDIYYDVYAAESKDTGMGVKVNSDSTISLIWVANNTKEERKIPFIKESVGYLSLIKQDNLVTLQYNNRAVSIEGDEYSFTGWTMGSYGTVLVDKIAFSLNGTLPRPREYFDLFRNQRLDNVPRPNGAASFIYVNEAGRPNVTELTSEDFVYENEYFYSSVQSATTTSIWSIDNSTGFPVEYSLDQGTTWLSLPVQLSLPVNYPNIIFRHQTDSDGEYFIDLIASESNALPMAFFDVVVDGQIHLPASIGEGYYDVDQSDMTNSSVQIVAQEDQIRTVEFLGEVNAFDAAWLDTAGASVYINGKPSALSNMSPNQIYHVVVVYDTAKASVTFNPNKNVNSSIVGIGASSVAYTESDAFYIFNTFAGNTFVSGIDLIDKLSDGVSPNAATAGEPVGALSVQWNN